MESSNILEQWTNRLNSLLLIKAIYRPVCGQSPYHLESSEPSGFNSWWIPSATHILAVLSSKTLLSGISSSSRTLQSFGLWGILLVTIIRRHGTFLWQLYNPSDSNEAALGSSRSGHFAMQGCANPGVKASMFTDMRH
jgi:hypothetical protein